MHAVVGTWDMEPSMKSSQDQALAGIMESVRQRPGFVQAFWTSDPEHPRVNVSFVVWETREHAEEFRRQVIGNSAAQLRAGVRNEGLRIVQVDATA